MITKEVARSTLIFMATGFLFIYYNEAFVIPYQYDDEPDNPYINALLSGGAILIMFLGLYTLQPFFKVIYSNVYNKQVSFRRGEKAEAG